MAVRGDEADPAVAARWKRFSEAITRATGLPIKTFEASDYNGVIQALATGQVDVAQSGASAYASAHELAGDKVAAILTTREAEGSMGYYAALLVKASSPYRSIADLRGKTLGYVDINSTSGYLLPRSEMRREGIDPDAYFGRSGFAGGHPQAVMALESGQFDAVLTQVSGGDPVNGFTTGAHFTLARRGLLKLSDVRIIWTAGPMPNSPIMVRTDRPPAMVDAIRGVLAAMPYDEPDVWVEIGQTPGAQLAAVDHSFYEMVIRLRDEEIAARRPGAQASTADKGKQP
jgi:phosphonate transport system substrate-binding protein